MKRILLPALVIVFIPLCLWASYGKSNVLQKEIKRSPLIVAPLPSTTQSQASPSAPGKGCVKNTFYPFTIHILSSQSLSDAKRSMERLNDTLGTVFITKTDLGATGIWYRLDYGLFPIAKEAMQKMRELQRKGVIDKGAFIGGPTPYTENGGCLRVAVGAFPDMKSAKMVHADLTQLGLNPAITKR